MIILDLVSFCSLAWLFVLIMFNLAVDTEKTIDPQTFEAVDMRPEQKRTRLMWFGIGAVLPMLTVLLHIILFFAGIR